MRHTPESIDLFAAGMRKDPHSYFGKLAIPEFERYERAKREGFLTVKIRNDDGVAPPERRHFWAWCDAMNFPCMQVIHFERYSKITYDCDTTGYPYTCGVTDEDGLLFHRMVTSKWVADDSNGVFGTHHFGVYGVPNKDAPEVARQIWAVLRSRVTMNAEQREKHLRKVWTE